MFKTNHSLKYIMKHTLSELYPLYSEVSGYKYEISLESSCVNYMPSLFLYFDISYCRTRLLPCKAGYDRRKTSVGS